MQTGTVKWFNDTRGYGFINPDSDNKRDIFVHYLDVEMKGRRTLLEGQKVEFEETTGKEGKPKARTVRPLA